MKPIPIMRESSESPDSENPDSESPVSESAARDPTLMIKLAGRVHGIVHTQLIYVAAKLGLADLLNGGTMSVEKLAKATQTIESRLYRIMRALASIGIFAESQPGYFKLTPLAELLRTDSPDSMRDFAIMMGSPWHAGAWANILHSVTQEESSFRGLYQTELFEYLQENPQAAAEFNQAMTFTSQKQAGAVSQAYDFSGAGTVVDVGGGHGFLLSSLLKVYDGMSGILFDLPSVASEARKFLGMAGLGKRCQVIEGSFFSGVPKGGDLYILKYIIHDWDGEDALKILNNCRKAMNPSNKLLVIDAVVPLKKPSFGKTWADIEMMVLLPNGRERTEAEFCDLFQRSGFELCNIIPMRSELSILEAIPKD
jgi:hypothetical protein